jgi:hypothetical protein
MFGHFYFNWNGPREGLNEYGKKLEAACKRSGTKLIGIYAPHQDNWNYVSIIEGKTMADVYKTWGEVGFMTKEMTNSVIKYFTEMYPKSEVGL